MTQRLLALGLGAALVAGTTVATTVLVASAAEPVVLLSGTTPATAPFPSDRWTVSDPAQTTGRRVALPTAGCDAAGRSLCDDLAQINTLDGFDLQPRVTLPFSGPVDLLSITPQTVYVEGGGTRTGLVQLVLDPASGTVAGLTDAFLEPATTYELVVTSGVRAVGGAAVDPCGGACPTGVTERRTPFTTMDPHNTLDEARAQLDAGTAYDAVGIASDSRTVDFTKTFADGSRAVFDRARATQVTRQDQRSVDPNAPRTTQSALNTSTAALFGVGSILSPQYVDPEGVVPTVPTGSAPTPLSSARIGVTMMAPVPAPASTALTCLRPVVFGPGFTRSKYDLWLSADGLPNKGFAAFATDPLGHSYGPASTFTVPSAVPGQVLTGTAFGRGKDLDGDGRISDSEGVGPTFRFAADGTTPETPNPRATVGLRDGLIQTVVDNMALVRALEKGVDLDGNDTIDTCTGDKAVSYYGQSFGGIYGTMLLGTDPKVTTGVPNVPGGPVVDIARESGFRGNLAAVLQANDPDLRNGGPGRNGFTESLPLRLDPRVTDPVAGATAVQEFFARGNWVSRAGSPETYAPRLGDGGQFADKDVLVQVAYTDGTVPNPTSGTLLRAGDLYDKAWVYRNDRTATFAANPHGFLLDPTVAGRQQAQEQVAEFIAAGVVLDPDGAGNVWELADTPQYRQQLDCLHYADPQTGQGRTVAGPSPTGVPDCPDRSGTVTRAQVAPVVEPSATPTASMSPAASPSPSTSTSPAASTSPSTSTSPSSSPGPVGVDGLYRPLVPSRILDTRPSSRAPVSSSSDLQLMVLGRGGIPTSGVRAVVVNVTVPVPAAGGHLQVYPTGSQPSPRTSNLNWPARRTVANAVTVGVGNAGRISLGVSAGTVDVVVDVLGWYGDATRAGGSALRPLRPERVLDTRQTRTPVQGGADRRLPVLGRGGVPASGVDGVVLSLTALGATTSADVQVYPTGSKPAVRTSSTNVVPGQTVAAHVPSALGTDGSVTLSVSRGSVQLVADVLGYYASGSSRFVPLVPRRVLDTRPGAPLLAEADRPVVLAGRDGVPTGATAVLVNVTGVEATAAVDVQVYPTGDRPARRTSVLNLGPGQAVPNLVLARLSGGSATFSVSRGSVDLVLDVVGYVVE